MAALDGTANELYVSPQIEALLGFSQKEWIEDPVLWYTAAAPRRPRPLEQRVRADLRQRRAVSSVYRFVARDGRVVWVRGEAKLVRDEAGRPLFLQGVAFDITAIKQAEEELRLLNQTLEERVRERTAEAEQRAEELARSNRELEGFGRVVAHDLREPLRTHEEPSRRNWPTTSRTSWREQGREYRRADRQRRRPHAQPDRQAARLLPRRLGREVVRAGRKCARCSPPPAPTCTRPSRRAAPRSRPARCRACWPTPRSWCNSSKTSSTTP